MLAKCAQAGRVRGICQSVYIYGQRNTRPRKVLDGRSLFTMNRHCHFSGIVRFVLSRMLHPFWKDLFASRRVSEPVTALRMAAFTIFFSNKG